MDSKPAIKSRTMIFNLLSALAAFCAAFGLDWGLTETMQTQIAMGIVGVVNVVNMALRKDTSKAIQGILN